MWGEPSFHFVKKKKRVNLSIKLERCLNVSGLLVM